VESLMKAGVGRPSWVTVTNEAVVGTEGNAYFPPDSVVAGTLHNSPPAIPRGRSLDLTPGLLTPGLPEIVATKSLNHSGEFPWAT
jgi:hypothetical protein